MAFQKMMCFFALSLVLVLNQIQQAWALDLDWSGQFRAEAHMVKNYSLDPGNITTDTTRSGAGGYYIPGGGNSTAHFQTLFMRLRPTAIVNDNVYLKSEFWVGDPVFGFFGNGAPYTTDQRQFYSTQSRGSFISAQRFWGEFLSDIGTVQVGRAPLNWGLGLFWSSGDGVWDRYQSTGDVIRLVSKFGAFSFTPAIVKYSMGNSVGGAINPTTSVTSPGGGGLSDYSLAFKYENPDEDFEGGVNFIKRIAGGAQTHFLGIDATASGMNYNIWDIYLKKRFGKLSLGGEVPVTSGDLSGVKYNAYAVALEADMKYSDRWRTGLKAGRAPGQPSTAIGGRPDKFRAFYFNPNYRLGLVMFNYQFANFAGPNTQNSATTSAASLKSPFDNPITNAQYLSLAQYWTTERWTHHVGFVYAKAIETAKAGRRFYNQVEHRFVDNVAGVDQKDSLGWELDLGTSLKWDDHLEFRFDTGLWFPGQFYDFSNRTVGNGGSTVWATVFGIGANF